MKKQFVRDLKPGTAIDDVFYLGRRDVKERRDGAPFLAMELQDRTGRLAAIMWDRVEDALRCVEAGGFYRVQGKMGDYQGRPQLTVSVMLPVDTGDVDRGDFVACSRLDRAEMMRELKGYSLEVQNPQLKKLLKTFLDDEQFVEQFSLAPGGARVHHNYLGGLLEHTVVMCRMARVVKAVYTELDPDLLMTGVILHDVGKTREYVYDVALDHTFDGRLIGHIVIGYEMVRDRIAAIDGFPEEQARMLLHVMLSHHGHLEFGSPKTPKFAEAWVVYVLDNLDSRLMMFRDTVEKNQGAKWTDFHQFLETNVYIKDPTG